MSLRNFFLGDFFEPLGLARPLAKPCPVIAHTMLEPQTDTIDFVDLAAAPRRAAQGDQHAVRPAVVVREIRKCEFALRQLRTAHSFPFVLDAIHQSRGMPESRMIFRNFSTSVFTTCANSSGVLPTITSPSCANRSFTSGASSAARIAL
ncbi:hypothetical protein D3C83_27770 [compost metagenome]